MFTRIVRSIVSSNLSKRASRLNKRALVLERLEARNVPAILPGQVVQFAEWQDSDGDTVTVRVTGSVDSPTTKGFKIELEGGVNDKADAHSITLTGLNQGNGLDVVVTPNKSLVQPNTPAGGVFATLYTPGYTNVFKLETDDPAMTDLGLIHLSAAIVNKIDFGKHLYESDPQKNPPVRPEPRGYHAGSGAGTGGGSQQHPEQPAGHRLRDVQTCHRADPPRGNKRGEHWGSGHQRCRERGNQESV